MEKQVRIDEEGYLVIKTYFGDGAWTTKKYKVENGKFVEVKE